MPVIGRITLLETVIQDLTGLSQPADYIPAKHYCLSRAKPNGIKPYSSFAHCLFPPLRGTWTIPDSSPLSLLQPTVDLERDPTPHSFSKGIVYDRPGAYDGSKLGHFDISPSLVLNCSYPWTYEVQAAFSLVCAPPSRSCATECCTAFRHAE